MKNQTENETFEPDFVEEVEEGLEKVSFCGSWLDSKTSQLDDVLLGKLEKAVHKQTAQIQHNDLVKIALENDPIDLAHALPKIPPAARVLLYTCLADLKAKCSFLVNASSIPRMTILRALSDEEIKVLIQQMPADDAVEVLDDMPNHRVKRVLQMIDMAKRQKIVALLKHGRFTAGRLMTNEFFAFHFNAKVGDVVACIRDNPGTDLTLQVFVMNDQNELIGFVPDRTLIVNPPSVPLKTLMRPIVHRVMVDASREELVELFERYHLPVLPVVNEKDHLLGIVTREVIVEVLEDIGNETIANIGGTAEDVGSGDSTLTRFVARAPWLLVTLLAGLLTSTGLSCFHSCPWFFIVPFFVPLINGMSGNVGIQCSTVLVRSLATGEISVATRRSAIKREFRVGTLIGISFGLLCGVVVYLLNYFGLQFIQANPLLITIVVSAGVLGACFTATVLGTLTPLFFAKFRIDPAIASGPIVTAFNDVLSTYMYFLVTWLVSLAFAEMMPAM